MYVDICIYFLLDCEFPLNIHSNTAKVFCIHNK